MLVAFARFTKSWQEEKTRKLLKRKNIFQHKKEALKSVPSSCIKHGAEEKNMRGRPNIPGIQRRITITILSLSLLSLLSLSHGHFKSKANEMQ